MDKYKSAVKEYEISRRLVVHHQRRRAEFISLCENLDSDGGGDLCFVGVTAEFKDILDNDNGYVPYVEVLEDHGCKYCYQSYIVKIEDLAKAKQRFGIAKRRLSTIGRSLINEVDL